MAEFDYQVDHYNKQGQVVRRDPYRMVIDSDGRRMERPPGSGIWYAPDGKVIKDESAAIRAKAEEQEKIAAAAKEEAASLERAKAKAALRQEVMAELEAEKKAKQNNGHRS